MSQKSCRTYEKAKDLKVKTDKFLLFAVIEPVSP